MVRRPRVSERRREYETSMTVDESGIARINPVVAFSFYVGCTSDYLCDFLFFLFVWLVMICAFLFLRTVGLVRIIRIRPVEPTSLTGG